MENKFANNNLTGSANTSKNGNIGSALSSINQGFIESEIKDKARKYKIPYIDIRNVYVNPDIALSFSYEELLELKIVPFYKQTDKFRFAIPNPEDPKLIEFLKTLKEDKKYDIALFLASEQGIDIQLEKIKPQDYSPTEAATEIQEQEIGTTAEELESLNELKDKIETTNALEALSLLNLGALKLKSSDMHFQPEEKKVLIRFRVDGVLKTVFDIQPKIYEGILNQIKFKARMKMNINTIPQDGRYFITVSERKVDIRVSVLPTDYGETIVQRLLDNKNKSIDLSTLGFQGRNLNILNNIKDVRNGLILVTGPTGSGKTTTLYSILNILNDPEKKIITLEDPIEYHLDGISQSQINEKHGYSFASGLRAILRQDPDIVMVGEVRDLDTAETAAQAALTGHTVMSTLHTNSAIATISRLLNMGLPPFMIAPSLNTVIAQRLVRKICDECAIPRVLEDTELEEIKNTLKGISNLEIPKEIKEAKGCDKCSHSGFIGQTTVSEVFNMTPELQRLILDNKSEHELLEFIISQGMITMKQDGMMKVIAGITTIQEIRRVITD